MQPVSIRLEPEALARADVLAELLTAGLSADPLARVVARGGRLTRHAVLRLAVLRGLDALEAEHAAGGAR